MKALSVTQPWASVICSGMKDVENRKWQAAQVPGRILIHATSSKPDKKLELGLNEYAAPLKNARLMGWVPEYEDMPLGSIIGYVDVYDIVTNSDSFWAQKDCFHWCLKDAYLFDEPIPGVKGVRGHLFDYPLDENNLPPAHKVELLPMERHKTKLIIPVSPYVMSEIEAGANEIDFDLNNDNFSLFCDEDGMPLETSSVEFVCGDKRIVKECEIDPAPLQDPDGNDYSFISQHDEQLVLWDVAILLK